LIISLSFSASITRRFHFRRCFSFAMITDATPPASAAADYAIDAAF
jgi:hypothetical protein